MRKMGLDFSRLLASILMVSSAGVLIGGCSQTNKPVRSPIKVPPTVLVPLGIPTDDSVASTGTSYYAARVIPGSEYFASIVALSDSAQFTVYEDSTFSDGGFFRGPLSKLPQSSPFIAYGDRIFFKVHNPGGALRSVHYTLLVMEKPQGPNETEIGIQVPLGTVVVGHVATRQGSGYIATGLTPGREHVISLVGATGDVELCPPLLSAPVGTAQECRETAADDSLAFGVLCGPVNREGAGYVLLVK